MTRPRATLPLGSNRFERFERPTHLRSRLWGVVQNFVFRTTPPMMNAWRCWLLRRFGARIGPGVAIHPSVRLTHPWNLAIGGGSRLEREVIIEAMGHVTIGRHVLISQYAHICAGDHDYTDPAMEILPTAITIEDRVWVAADAFVGPNARIGRGSMVAARSSVFGQLPEHMVCVGEPARPRRERPPPQEDLSSPLHGSP